MQVLVCDDEQLARDRLKRLLQDIPDVTVVGEASNGRKAVLNSQQLNPDVVLLDIRMPEMDGMEAARHLMSLEHPPAIIFCTAYDEHALEAFRVNAVDYLLKPVNRDDLAEALIRAGTLKASQMEGIEQGQKHDHRRRHISARTHRGIELIPVDDIRYFRADQKYVTVRHSNGEILIDETLKELEDEFAEGFVRIHRNALVALSHLEGMDMSPGGQHQVRMRDIPERLTVSRRHVAGLRKVMQHL